MAYPTRLPTVVFAALTIVAACGDESSTGGSGGETTPSGPTTTGSGPSTGASMTTGGGVGGEGGGGGPPSGLVPMFVAQGHVGRTMISCDDGQTWIEDRSDDDTVRCFENDFDCDHHPGAANGMAWYDGAFFATYGWGMPGGIRRSLDGITWTQVLGETTFGGVAAGAGRIIGAARKPQASVDGGDTWDGLIDIPLGNVYNVREAAFAAFDEGRFVLAGNDGDIRFIAVSSDGLTFSLPPVPDDCNISFYASGGIAFGAGAIVITDGGAQACRSTDGGATWGVADIGGTIGSSLVFGPDGFYGWGGGQVFHSADGATWTSQDMTESFDLGAVAVSDEGTFVAVRGGWNQWYESQRFYRSTDGVTWTELADGTYTGSHPIRDIVFGYGEASASCP